MYATNLVETARCAPPPPPRRRARARAAPRALQTRVAVRRMIVADPALPPIQRGAARFIHGERCFTSTTDCDDYLQMQQRGASQLAATPCSSPSPSRTTRRWRAGASSSRCTCCASTSRSTTSASGCADASPRAARARPPCTRAQEHGILVAIFPILKLRKTERCARPRRTRAPRARPARAAQPSPHPPPRRTCPQALLGGEPAQPAGAPRRVLEQPLRALQEGRPERPAQERHLHDRLERRLAPALLHARQAQPRPPRDLRHRQDAQLGVRLLPVRATSAAPPPPRHLRALSSALCHTHPQHVRAAAGCCGSAPRRL